MYHWLNVTVCTVDHSMMEVVRLVMVMDMSELDLVKTILCPATPQAAKLADKFLGIMFRARTDIDDGNTLPEYPSWEPNQPNPFATYDFQNDKQSHHLDECDATTFSSDEDSLLS
jgi:hypothetical protein